METREQLRYRPDRLPAADAVDRSRSLLEAMRRRRSVRYFSPEPVPDELLRNAIEVAATAPSGANQQPWTFVVVADPQLRGLIRDAAEAEERYSYTGAVTSEWLDELRLVKAHITEASHLVVVFRQSHRVGQHGAEHQNYYSGESVGIAVGMLAMTLHLAGVGLLVHAPPPAKFLADLLQRPRSETAFAIVSVGYAADDCVVPDLPRKSLDEVLVRK
ncbi:nitroreductase family protein [Cryptosporangium phraense]|uniref:Nitroreductase family protein n=1 Tax=Cryptosporangium phraense TaxID=2593070 RepID=A0A545AUR7_9ACTN|nr:nitroreductase family protein [Cryptosporangium phraense]TQS45076.1 nitroreductase family protein [Cryptosporangium phraense]